MDSELEDLSDNRTCRHRERKFPLFECLTGKPQRVCGTLVSCRKQEPSVTGQVHFPSVAMVQLSLLHYLWLQQIWAPESGPKSLHSKPEAKSLGVSLQSSHILLAVPHSFGLGTPRLQREDQLLSSAPPLEVELSSKPQNPFLIHG